MNTSTKAMQSFIKAYADEIQPGASTTTTMKIEDEIKEAHDLSLIEWNDPTAVERGEEYLHTVVCSILPLCWTLNHSPCIGGTTGPDFGKHVNIMRKEYAGQS